MVTVRDDDPEPLSSKDTAQSVLFDPRLAVLPVCSDPSSILYVVVNESSDFAVTETAVPLLNLSSILLCAGIAIVFTVGAESPTAV